MKIEKNHSLKNYNTFGIDVRAREFVSVHSVDELKEAIAENRG
jgi:UDP-N-acetylmuramate dehydrogenase